MAKERKAREVTSKRAASSAGSTPVEERAKREGVASDEAARRTTVELLRAGEIARMLPSLRRWLEDLEARVDGPIDTLPALEELERVRSVHAILVPPARERRLTQVRQRFLEAVRQSHRDGVHDEERAARAVLNHIGAGGPFLEEARKIGLEAIRRVLRVKVRRGRPPRRSGALDGVPSAAGEIERAIIEVMAERLEMPRTTPAALRVEKSRRLKKR